MSRTSNDEFDSKGNLLNGFDYTVQAWVKDGRVLRCGHPEALPCGCTGKTFEGRTIGEVRAIAARADEMLSDMQSATAQVSANLSYGFKGAIR